MRLQMVMVLVLAAACTPRLTRFRGGLSDCTSVVLDNDAILCHGRPVARIECFAPRQETCTALAVRYPDGERVFLYQPALFDPARAGSYRQRYHDSRNRVERQHPVAQRSTRSARRVFQRLGSPARPSISKCTGPGCGFSRRRRMAGGSPIRFRRCYSWLRDFTLSYFAAGTM